MKCISPMTTIILDILHTTYVAMCKDVMHWVMSFFEPHSRIDELNPLLAAMPQHPGFARFNSPYSKLTQYSCKEMNALRDVIVPDFTATLSQPSACQRIPITDALLCIKNSVYFPLVPLYWYHTEPTIEYME